MTVSGLGSPGARLTLDRALPGQPFRPLATVTVDSRGHYARTVTVANTATYRSRGVTGLVSHANKVVAQDRMTFGAVRNAFRTYTLSGKVYPARKGQLVKLSYLNGSSYTPLASVSTDQYGRWSYKHAYNFTKTYTFKAVSAATTAQRLEGRDAEGRRQVGEPHRSAAQPHRSTGLGRARPWQAGPGGNPTGTPGRPAPWKAARGAMAEPGQDISEVADGVFLVRGSQVNWYLLREGRAVTLVDSGYPADAERVEASVRYVGARPEDLAALLVTHAHTDHIGAANHLHERYGTPMYLHPAEVPHAQRQYLEQISLRAVVVRAGGPGCCAGPGTPSPPAAPPTSQPPMRSRCPRPPRTAPWTCPAGPCRCSRPGHTSGHTAYLLPRAGAVITGDALVTSHPTTATPHGPQLIASYFQHDEARARASLDAIATLPARLVLPGHGEPWDGDLAAAIAAARA